MSKIPLPHTGYEPQQFTLYGVTFTCQLQRDEDHGPPWEDDDGRGIVTAWIDRLDRDAADAAQLRILSSDHGRARYFDQLATLQKATRDQWGLGPEAMQELLAEFTQYTEATIPREIVIDRAVQLEYQFLRDWCEDRWEYVGVIVTLDGAHGIERSLWGIESSEQDYLNETARELAEEILRDRATLQTLRANVKQARQYLSTYERAVARFAQAAALKRRKAAR